MLKKRNRKILKEIKKIMYGMENRDYEVVSIAIDIGGDGNKTIPFLYINNDVFKFRIEESFKDEKESWKYAYLIQLIENIESQLTELCGAHLQNSDVNPEKFLNQYEDNYKKDDEVVKKVHNLTNELFNNVCDIFEEGVIYDEEPKTN